MSAILASPDTSTPQSQSPVTTTFIQATPPAAPIIVGGSSYGPPAQQAQPTGAEAKVICPACKTQNDSSSTFCQSCGTRLKS
jgi:hypothetical protein